MSEDAFFAYARARYQLKLEREGGFPPPWTNDPILQRFRFCNVHREDDKTTTWFRQKFRSQSTLPSVLLTGTLIFRWFNRIETGEILLREQLLHRWDSERARRVLGDVHPLVTGAYMVKTPAGKDKLEGVIWCIEQALPMLPEMARQMQARRSLQRATEALQALPYLGPFMAYEIVTDLRWTPVLRTARDTLSWANPGPGAARGLGRVLQGNKDHYDRHSPHQAAEMQAGMQHLLKISQRKTCWPERWPSWEMREVEHTLCEFDKYERARLGEGTPKQLFRGGST